MIKYRIMKNADFKPMPGFEYGKIVDVIGKTVLVATFLPNCYKQTGYHFSGGRDEGTGICSVFFDAMYLAQFENDPEYFAGTVMHELGHLVNGDLENANTKEMKKERIKTFSEGKVDARELAADRFAADQIGPVRMIKCLEKTKENRKKRGDVGAAFAVKEIERRIAALEEYRDEARQKRRQERMKQTSKDKA